MQAASLQEAGDWEGVETIMPRVREVTRAQLAAGDAPDMQPLWSFRFDVAPTTRLAIAEAHARAAVASARRCGGQVHAAHRAAVTAPPHRNRRIRIGYVSANFNRAHPVANQMRTVFGLHDEKRFEIFV